MLASSVAEQQEAVWWRSRFRDTGRGPSKNWCEAVLQSLERWPQERSLTPFDHIFIVILHGPLRFREESGSGCARSWSGALGYPTNQTGLSRTLQSGPRIQVVFLSRFFFLFFFFLKLFLHRYLKVRWCELRSIHQPDGHRQSQQQRSQC